MQNKIKYTFILWIVFFCSLSAQDVKRPPVWGIAKMTFLVSDMDATREYYGRFLGFDETFSYPSPLGLIVSFKVNDRQFLEFIVDKDAKEKKRLVSVSFETDTVEQMRCYLQSQGVAVPERPVIDGAGNEVFVVVDTWGNSIEFIDLKKDGLHRMSKGKYLSENRISKRIHHAGLYAEKIDEKDPFWVGALKCREMIRYPEDRVQVPTILYLDLGDCTENIEFYSPNNIHVSHPCFVVDDMQETIYTLKERLGEQILKKPSIGKLKRWLLNLYNSDDTRVEFTEAHCIR